MELKTRAALISRVADAWKEQYFTRGKGWGYKGIGGDKYRNTWLALKALPPDATGEDVAAIIGNTSWIGNECSECKRDVAVTVRLGEEPDYDSLTAWVCPDCLRAALALAESAT